MPHRLLCSCRGLASLPSRPMGLLIAAPRWGQSAGRSQPVQHLRVEQGSSRGCVLQCSTREMKQNKSSKLVRKLACMGQRCQPMVGQSMLTRQPALASCHQTSSTLSSCAFNQGSSKIMQLTMPILGKTTNHVIFNRHLHLQGPWQTKQTLV